MQHSLREEGETRYVLRASASAHLRVSTCTYLRCCMPRVRDCVHTRVMLDANVPAYASTLGGISCA